MEFQSLDVEILRLQNKRAQYALHMEKLGIAAVAEASRPVTSTLDMGHICSRWSQIASGETSLWNSLSFAGNGWHHLEMLEEAFKHGGQSA